ncbi:MAG: hypothetical protein LW701_10350 [Fluviicola sp.]|jgi:hypothetical protein|nr:hypothetical protein [Fluviicola sp.]
MGIQNTFTIHTNSVEQSNALKAFVKALKMEYIVVKDEINFPSMTEQEIIDQAIKVNTEIAQGKYISHAELEKKANRW